MMQPMMLMLAVILLVVPVSAASLYDRPAVVANVECNTWYSTKQSSGAPHALCFIDTLAPTAYTTARWAVLYPVTCPASQFDTNATLAWVYPHKMCVELPPVHESTAAHSFIQQFQPGCVPRLKEKEFRELPVRNLSLHNQRP